MGATILFLGLLIFLAHLFNALFSKKRIPDVLLLLAIGIIVGPVFHIVTPEDLGGLGSIFSSLTLLFILFDSGVDMSINALRNYWKGFVQVTFSSFILSMITVSIIGHFMDFEWKASLMLGAMVSGTAAAIVIPIIKQMRVSEYTATVLSMESALSAVLGIVVSLGFMESYRMGAMNVGSMLGQVIASVLMALVIGVIGGILWSGFLDRIRKLQNSMFLTPAFVFVVYGASEALGYSGPIAALAFGIVMGNIDYFDFSFLHKFSHHEMRYLEPNEKSFFKELVFVFKTFFFVYIGICMPFTNAQALLYGLIITAALFVARFILLAIVGRNNEANDRLTVSIMIPKGLATAVLASIPEQVNIQAGREIIPDAEMIKHVTYAIILFSIIICSTLVILTRKRLIADEAQKDTNIPDPIPFDAEYASENQPEEESLQNQ